MPDALADAPAVSSPVSSRWPMPPFVKGSLALHGVAAAAALAVPHAWPWALAAVAADHAALTAAGLWPRSRLLGPNMLRLPEASVARGEVALTIDDGPDPEVTPRVLDLLDAHGAVATFYAIARRVERHPALAREIVARGHALENHSDSHVHTFSLSGPRGFAREIGQAQARIEAATGRRPRTFRAPAGLRNPFLAPVLHREGLQLVSWTRRGFDTREREPARVLARLVRGLAAGDILLLHDGHAARGREGRPVILDVLPPLLDALHAARLRTVTVPQALASSSDEPGTSLPSSHPA